MCRTDTRTARAGQPRLPRTFQFRRPVTALVLGFCLSAAAPTVSAQQRATVETLDSRLERVERVLDQSLLSVVQQVNQLQDELRELRGEVESLNHELQNATRRNRDLYRDTDRRLGELEDNQRRLPAGVAIDDLESGSFSDETQPAPGAEGDDNSAAVIVDGETGSDAAGDAGATSRRSATAAEQQRYTEAYETLAAGDNGGAVESFEQFIGEYPDGPFTDNAWYWLGEAQYAERKFEAALDSFGEVIGAFPQSSKVPDARLKIGFTLFEQNEYGNARAVLIGVQNDYPGRSASVLARKRLQQMDRDGL